MHRCTRRQYPHYLPSPCIGSTVLNSLIRLHDRTANLCAALFTSPLSLTNSNVSSLYTARQTSISPNSFIDPSEFGLVYFLTLPHTFRPWPCWNINVLVT